MRVAIRVDASQLIGTGHMVRCLTLAGQFAAQGAEIHVISRHVTDQLRTAIASRGYAISILPGASSHKRETWCPHASWLQAHWEEDATATKAVVEKYQCDVLVVDHYALDHRWESALRAAAGTVFAIDDLADRRHDCDYLLDQNFMHDYTARYDSLITNECVPLLGPSYALLRPEFRRSRESAPVRDGRIRRILVFMGGIDNANTTSIALRGIDMLKLNSVAVDVVVGASCPHRHEIDALSRSIRQCRLFGSVDTLAPLMSAADLAIGASGTATWERCCVGLPTLTMSIADNQEPIAEGSQLAGFAINLGRCERVTPELIARGIKHLLGNPLLVQQMSQAGMRLVDGMGAERVIETILTGVHAETKSA